MWERGDTFSVELSETERIVLNRLLNHGVFRRVEDAYLYMRFDGEYENLSEYDQFLGDEIVLLQEHKIPVDYAVEMQELNAATIAYHHRLGRNTDETEFKGKGSRALALMPTHNPRHRTSPLYALFTEKTEIDFLRRLEKSYRLKVRAVSTVDELEKEIEKSLPLDLLIVAGHGGQNFIHLGSPNQAYGRYFYEPNGYLDVKDEVLILRKLGHGSHIFLNSCLTGKGREKGKNIANHLANQTRATIIAPEELGNLNRTRLISTDPFNVRMYDGEGKDITYVTRKT